MTECLILWDYLAETGEPSKLIAIHKLHRDGKLSCTNYGEFNCPLCLYLRGDTDGDDSGCYDCLWPGEYNPYCAKCELPNSPFNEWRFADEKSEYKTAAEKVLDLLLSIEF